MTTTVAVQFVLGRYHATAWGRAANEGVPEWPPSPWRILRALYATWKARLPDLPDAEVHGLLDVLADPPTFRLPPHGEGHTRHYMPDASFADVAGRRVAKDKVLDAFAAVPRDLPVVVEWPGECDASQREALASLLARLSYLGRAESAVHARLVAPGEDPIPVSASPSYRTSAPIGPGASGVAVLVADRPLDVHALVSRTIDLRRARRIDPPGARRITYEWVAAIDATRSSRKAAALEPTRVVAARLAIGADAPPLRHSAVTMADALRQAAMSRFGRLHDGRPSPILAGKDAVSVPLRGHAHAHYLPLQSPETSRSHLSHVVVWAPQGIDEDGLVAIASLRRLHERSYLRNFRPCRLALEAYGDIVDVAPELVGPSATWESFTPFAASRHAKKGVSWVDHLRAEVARELAYRGLPGPDRVEMLPGDWASFRTYRIAERLPDARRASGLRLEFGSEVAGPIALGALSHFGLGLFIPRRT